MPWSGPMHPGTPRAPGPSEGLAGASPGRRKRRRRPVDCAWASLEQTPVCVLEDNPRSFPGVVHASNQAVAGGGAGLPGVFLAEASPLTSPRRPRPCAPKALDNQHSCFGAQDAVAAGVHGFRPASRGFTRGNRRAAPSGPDGNGALPPGPLPRREGGGRTATANGAWAGSPCYGRQRQRGDGALGRQGAAPDGDG